jgi:hypothetical protein
LCVVCSCSSKTERRSVGFGACATAVAAKKSRNSVVINFIICWTPRQQLGHSLTRIHITPASILVMSSERRHIDAPGAGSSCTPVISSEERDTEGAPSRETLCHLQCHRNIALLTVMVSAANPSIYFLLTHYRRRFVENSMSQQGLNDHGDIAHDGRYRHVSVEILRG